MEDMATIQPASASPFCRANTYVQGLIDEAQTIQTYTRLSQEAQNFEEFKEILGDELNHALTFALRYAIELGIPIPEDGLEDLIGRAFNDEQSDV